MSDKIKQKRSSFRVEYPITARPRFLFRDQRCEVVDLCEHGLSFEYKAADRLKPAQAVIGTVVFADNQSFDVEGVVVRISEGVVALKCHKGVPYQRIVQEQRLLRKKFGSRL